MYAATSPSWQSASAGATSSTASPSWPGLWACGVAKPPMPMSMGLFLYAVGRLATIVPITAGAVGVAEMAYIIAVY